MIPTVSLSGLRILWSIGGANYQTAGASEHDGKVLWHDQFVKSIIVHGFSLSGSKVSGLPCAWSSKVLYPGLTDQTLKMVLFFSAEKASIGTRAIGDRAVHLAVDAIAEVLRQNPSTGLRHSIIHAHEPAEHASSVTANFPVALVSAMGFSLHEHSFWS